MAVWQQWLSRLSGGSAGNKSLALAAVLAVPLMLVAVWHYAAQPAMVALLDQAVTGNDRARILSQLEAQGIRYQIKGDRLLVPVAQRAQALAGLQARDLLPADSSRGFAALANEQKWYLSSDQNRQFYTLALQDELGRVLGTYPWVRKATVIVSHPHQTGFGASHQRPTASVNIVTRAEPLDQNKADAIAGLISGAVAEMRPSDVAVIDANAGRQWKARFKDDAVSGEAQDLKQALEDAYRLKIVDALRYIDNVIVVIDVEVDPVRRQTQSDRVESGSGVLKREQAEASTPSPGVPPLLRLPAEPAATITKSDREYEPLVSRRRETSNDPGGLPTRVSVTVNVPRSFLVSIYTHARGASANPTDAELRPTIDEQLQRIRRQIEPLIQARQPGQMVVDVYPDGSASPLPESRHANSDAGVPPLWIDGEIWAHASLIALGLIALFAMWMLVRRAVESSPRPALALPGGYTSDLQEAEPLAARPRPTTSDGGSGLLSHLQGEHPQTIALVLASLPLDRSVQILTALPSDEQARALRRIASLGPVDPEVLKNLSRELAPHLAVPLVTTRGGIQTAAELIRVLSPQAARQALWSLERESPDLADQLRRLMFGFEELAALADDSLKAVLREVAEEDLSTALTTADRRTKRRIVRLLPADGARRLKRSLKDIGPVRLSDVEAAQQRIADVARRLGEAGVIALTGEESPG